MNFGTFGNGSGGDSDNGSNGMVFSRSAATTDLRNRHAHIAIVGTGFSGIGAAVRFRQQGRSDFVLFESANDVGGTWRENTYPGIACDVPSILYSFSFALNPDWSRSYSPGGEIWNYLRDVAKRFGILPFIRFNHRVAEARWDDAEQIWHLQTQHGEYTADIVIGALGPLSVPMIPGLPGLETFKGKTFHSQQWDHDYDLTGKRVAVVGTGASSLQFIPQIQPKVAELHVYQRTPAWVVPRSERRISRLEKLVYKHLPFSQKLVRGGVYAMLEVRVIGFIKEQRIMKAIEKIARTHIARQIKDPELRRKVTPNYTIGCKRILLGNNYYPALASPNVEVITEGVTEVRENSVVAADGTEREVDTIIWGTGFYVTRNPMWDNLIGRDGRSLSETWAGGMEAYLGTQVPNFPNMFLVMGPNSGLGHTSMVYMIESNIDYIERAVRFIDRNNVTSIEIRQDVVDTFGDEIQRKMQGTVWTSGGCASWYLDERGRNTTLWPSFTFEYRQRCRDFDPARLTVRDRVGSAMLPSLEPVAVV